MSAELELRRIVALIGTAGVRRLNPGDDVACCLDRIPEIVGADSGLERQLENVGRRRRIVRKSPEKQIAHLIAAKGPRRELIGGSMEWVPLREIRMCGLERETADRTGHEKVESRTACPLVRGVSEHTMCSTGANLEDERIRC